MTVMTAADVASLTERDERTNKLRELLAHVRSLPPQELATLLARRRVERGFRWLAQNAPSPGWWRSCFNPNGTSRIQMRYSEENVLTLAFEYEPNFADDSGYVKDWKVLRHFFGPFWERRGRRLGFLGGYLQGLVPFPNKYPAVVIDNDLLTRLWREKLLDVPGDWRIQYRHPTALDRRFAALRFGAPRGRIRRLLAGVPWVGRVA